MRGTRYLAAVAGVAAGLVVGTVRAGDSAWLQPVSGNFEDGAKWSSAAVPASSDRALFDHPLEAEPSWYTVTLAGERAIAQLLVENAMLTLNVAGGSLNLSGQMRVGSEGVGLLEVAGGEVRSAGGVIAAGESAFGAVLLPQGGRWSTGPEHLVIGQAGAGSVSVDAGAMLSSGRTTLGAEPGAMGTVTVDGGTWDCTDLVLVGSAGSGGLQIYGGGAVSSVRGEIGGSGGTGMVLISGQNSVWENAGSLGIGRAEGSSGELHVELGGRVVAGSIEVGHVRGGEGMGRLAVVGGTVRVQGMLTVGETGTLEMESGQIGAQRLDLHGQAQLIGQSVLDLGDLRIEGTGTLDINGGAVVVRSDAAGRQAVHDQLLALIQAGRAGGEWDGLGIRSLAAGQDPHYTLALLINDRGNGMPLVSSLGQTQVGINDLLIVHALIGDLDLSGAIDGDDYYLADQGFRGLGGGYRFGDVNYDGRVDAEDYLLMDRAYLARAGSVAVGSAAASTSVPEPAGLLVFSASLLLLVRRTGA